MTDREPLLGPSPPGKPPPIPIWDWRAARLPCLRLLARSTANSRPEGDPLRIELLADLDRLDQWLLDFDSRPTLDISSKQAVEGWLSANSDLFTPAAPVAASVQAVAQRSQQARTLLAHGLAAMAASFATTIGVTSNPEADQTLAVVMRISGLLATIHARLEWAEAVDKPCDPIANLQVSTMPQDAALLAPPAAQGKVWLSVPLGLRAEATCLPLRSTDPRPAVASIVQRLAEANQDHRTLAPTLQTLTGTFLIPLNPNPSAADVEVPASDLELTGQVRSPSTLPELRLVDGKLLAEVGLGDVGTVTLSLRLLGGPQPGPSTTIQVGYDDSAPVFPGPESPSRVGPMVLPPVPFPYDFVMGSDSVDPDREGPPHNVRITRPFWISRYEVSIRNRELTLLGIDTAGNGGNLPFVGTWDDALAYCAELTDRERQLGRLPGGYVYRLPTEAEWEMCCRAGTSGEFWTGSTLTVEHAHFASPSGAPLRVDSKTPNDWGLHNMHGNAWEWCLDHWNNQTGYPQSTASNPSIDPYLPPFVPPPGTAANPIVRGGRWDLQAVSARSAARAYYNPADPGAGIRVVCAYPVP